MPACTESTTQVLRCTAIPGLTTKGQDHSALPIHQSSNLHG